MTTAPTTFAKVRTQRGGGPAATASMRSERADRPPVAELQRAWFGRSLAELFGTVAEVCGVTQAQLGARLGISAPTVSQLMSGRREKPGNPVVQERIVLLGRALDDFETGRTDATGLRRALDDLGAAGPRRSAPLSPRISAGTDPIAAAQFLRNTLATAASAREIEGAARLLDKRYPELAELLRVYGTGRTSEAIDHLQRHGLT
jgi:transcriptional regulator with XRE-family HTH domain